MKSLCTCVVVALAVGIIGDVSVARAEPTPKLFTAVTGDWLAGPGQERIRFEPGDGHNERGNVTGTYTMTLNGQSIHGRYIYRGTSMGGRLAMDVSARGEVARITFTVKLLGPDQLYVEGHGRQTIYKRVGSEPAADGGEPPAAKGPRTRQVQTPPAPGPERVFSRRPAAQ